MRTIDVLRIVPAFAVTLAFGACTAEVEDEGEPPEIEVEGGEAPEIDVDPADVDISTDTQEVLVPDIDIESSDTTRTL